MRTEWFGLALLAVAGCGGRDLILGGWDAGAQPPSPPPPSEPLELGEPRPIPGLASDDGADDDPSLSEDQLLLCFNSKRDGGLGKEDVWCTVRDEVNAPWQAPAPLVELNTDSRETGIALGLDGLLLWFSSDRDGGSGGLDVYTAGRPSRDAAWSAPERVAELSSADDDLVSSIDPTALQLLLARRAHRDEDEDQDDYDVFIAARESTSAPWQPPRPLEDLNTDAEESDAFLAEQGLALLFTRDEDLVIARRATSDSRFARGTALDVLNSDGDDRDPWATPELDYVLFASDREGEHKLYEARRRR